MKKSVYSTNLVTADSWEIVNSFMQKKFALEEMWASFKSRCDEVNKECKELREDAQRKKSEYESVLKENEILRNVNKKLEDQLGE